MISRVLSRIPNRFKELDMWVFVIKRIIYIIGFVGLCLIDQMIGSATGYIQYGYKNYTGIIIAIFMLTAYRFKDFFKVPYLIWIALFFLFRFLALDWLKEVIYNDLEVETNLWGIGLYGILLIRMFYSYVIEKKKPRMNWIPFVFCMIMLTGMTIIRSDYAWPKALLGTFLCFYLTDFKEKDLNNLFSGMVEGIIIGFLIIQGQAWLYRPYDMVRYEGMYSHPNMNALLYLYAYCAVLSEWYLMKLKRKNIFLRVPFIFIAGLVMGTMFYTGSRTAFITTIVLTIIFLFFQMISCRKRRLIELLLDGVILVAVISVCILPAYWLIRYIPVYVNAPLYFETDYANGLEGKIRKDDPIDSEKYVELGEAADEMFERYLWFLNKRTYEKVVQWIRDFPEGLTLSIEVDAAEISNNTDTDVNQLSDINEEDGNVIGYGIRKTSNNFIDSSSYHNELFSDHFYDIYHKSATFELPSCSILSNNEDYVIGILFTDGTRTNSNDVEGVLIDVNEEERKKIFSSSFGSMSEGAETIAKITFYFGEISRTEYADKVIDKFYLQELSTKSDIDDFSSEKYFGIIEENNYRIKEEVELGTDSKHPLTLSENQDRAYDVRVDIYKYFINKLTIIGEKNNVQGVWTSKYNFATHCHNVFLQISYDFGIIIGIMFIIVVLMLYVRVIIGLIKKRSGSWYYRLFVVTIYATLLVVFGMFEIDWTYGQLSFTMFFFVQYVVYHKEPERPQLAVNEDIATEPEPTYVSEQLSELPELEIEEL